MPHKTSPVNYRAYVSVNGPWSIGAGYVESWVPDSDIFASQEKPNSKLCRPVSIPCADCTPWKMSNQLFAEGTHLVTIQQPANH